jgi:hypothetical protein
MSHLTQDRVSHDKRLKKPQRKKPHEQKVHHPLFGEIPLVAKTYTDNAGQTRSLFEYDPDYQPELPRGAVRGNIRNQRFCPMCHVPKYFYVDQPRICVQCHKSFVFSGKEQRYWYETLHFHFGSVPIRCLSCRKAQREETNLHAQLASAKAALRHNSDDVIQLLALCEATVRYRLLVGRGNLQSAISAARRASKLSPQNKIAHYWEAVIQALAGRPTKARGLMASKKYRAEVSLENRKLLAEIVASREKGDV